MFIRLLSLVTGSLLLSTPAADLQIYVDDHPTGMTAIEVKGQAYIPVHAVAKISGTNFQIFKEEGQIMFVSPKGVTGSKKAFDAIYSPPKAASFGQSVRDWALKSAKLFDQLGDDAASRLSGDQDYMRTLRKSTRDHYQNLVKDANFLAETAGLWAKDPGSMYLTTSLSYWLGSTEAALNAEVKSGMDRMLSKESTAASVKPIQDLDGEGVNFHGELSLYSVKLAMWYDQTASRPN